MSPIDPRSLERFAERAVYANSPTCGKCGYDLVGLPVGSRCPECGTPTRARRSKRRFGEALTDAPPAYLRRLSAGFIFMGAGGLAGLGFFVLGMWQEVGGVLAAGAGAVWWAGAVLVTGPRADAARGEKDLVGEGAWLRWGNRVSQAAWAVAGLLEAALVASLGGLVGGVVATGRDAWLAAGLAVCVGIGLVGLGPLCAQLSGLAEWANDTVIAARLRAVALVIGACGGYIALAAAVILTTRGIAWLATVHGALGVPLFVAWPLLVGAVLVLFVTLVQMSRLSHWALANAATADGRASRLRERYERARHKADALRAIGEPVLPPQDAREA